jgi:hypothetical protein
VPSPEEGNDVIEFWSRLPYEAAPPQKRKPEPYGSKLGGMALDEVAAPLNLPVSSVVRIETRALRKAREWVEISDVDLAKMLGR